MKKLIETLRRNSIIKSLMDEFKKDFEDTYYSLDIKEKEIMLDYRDIMFRKWLYSPLRGGTYLTPNYIINNISQQIYPGDYSVMPYVKINLDNDGRLKFYRKFRYHSYDNSPVIDDLELLISFLAPTIIVRDENKYVIDGGELLVKKLNIQSDYYIEYLIEVGTRLGILELMKSIGCRCYKLGRYYYNYKELSTEEKIKRLIKVSIDIVKDNISEIIEFDDRNTVLDLLDNDITEEKIFEMIKSSLKIDRESACSISEEILDDEIICWFVRGEAGIYLDTYLTCILGYYLGIINPIYDQLFLSKLFVDFISHTDNILDRLTFIFTMEIGHNLTNFGEKVIMNQKKIKKNRFKPFVTKNIKECIKEYRDKKNIILCNLYKYNI